MVKNKQWNKNGIDYMQTLSPCVQMMSLIYLIVELCVLSVQQR